MTNEHGEVSAMVVIVVEAASLPAGKRRVVRMLTRNGRKIAFIDPAKVRRGWRLCADIGAAKYCPWLAIEYDSQHDYYRDSISLEEAVEKLREWKRAPVVTEELSAEEAIKMLTRHDHRVKQVARNRWKVRVEGEWLIRNADCALDILLYNIDCYAGVLD